MSERWVAPALPGDPQRVAATLGPSLQQLERVLGRVPVVYGDRLVTSATTLVDTDEVALVDCTGGGVTVTLPAASAALRGRRFNVKKMDAGANNVTISGTGDELPLVFNTQYESYTLQCALTATPATYGWVIL